MTLAISPMIFKSPLGTGYRAEADPGGASDPPSDFLYYMF